MRLPALALLLAGIAAPHPPAPAGPASPPPAAERWLFNSGERTAVGREAFAAGDAEAALASLEQALRLRPEAIETRFNAGTARLAAGSEGAIPLLEEVAAAAGEELAPLAWYNLGGARLSAGDAAGAVQAYEESLRRAPDLEPAKVNLELALRELERQQQEQDSGKGDPERQEPQERSQGGPGGEGPAGEKEPPPASPNRSPAEFRPQPDLTPEQAATLLAAVENLERDQRRRAAEERAARPAGVEIDW